MIPLSLQQTGMKFIINTTNLQSGGALQVALSLLEEWNVVSMSHEFHVFLSPQMLPLIDKDNFGGNFIFYPFGQNPTSTIFSTFTFYKKLRKLEDDIKPNAVFTIFGPALWTPKNPHLLGFANGYYLFDDSAFIQKRVLSNIFRRIKYYIRKSILFRQLKKEGSIYWVETKDAQQKLAKTINKPEDKIEIVGNTFGQSFKNASWQKDTTNKPFTLLYLSAYYEHKNFKIIPQVISILAERNIDCTFLLTLPESIFQAHFEKTTHRNYLKNAGPVSPKESYKLYAETEAVFMPSLLETFSANYPEAMKMQLPILCSDFNFSRNICGDAALYFDAENPMDIADKIGEIIANQPLQQQLIESGNIQLSKMETPESRAQKLIHILEQTAKQHL